MYVSKGAQSSGLVGSAAREKEKGKGAPPTCVYVLCNQIYVKSNTEIGLYKLTLCLL